MAIYRKAGSDRGRVEAPRDPVADLCDRALEPPRDIRPRLARATAVSPATTKIVTILVTRPAWLRLNETHAKKCLRTSAEKHSRRSNSMPLLASSGLASAESR